MAGGRPGADQGGEGLIIAGMLLAILVPPIGLVIGGIVVSRGDSRGWWPIVVGFGVLAMGAVLFLRFG